MIDPLERFLGSSVGLDLGPDSARVVVLRRFCNQVRLTVFGEEPYPSDELTAETVSETVRMLFSRLKIRQKEVVVQVDGKGIRHETMQTPLLPPDELKDWVREALAKRLHINLSQSQIIISFHIVIRFEKAFSVLAAYCQGKAMETVMDGVEKAGLIPEMIGACGFDQIQAYAFRNDDFFNKRSVIIDVSLKRIRMDLVESGSPSDFREIESDAIPDDRPSERSPQIREQLTEQLTRWRSGPNPLDEILLTGDEKNSDWIRSVLPEGIPIQTVQPLEGLIDEKKILPDGYGLAAGLAVKKLFPFVNTLDFSPEDRKRLATQSREKRQGMRFLLLGGTVVFTLMLLLFFVKQIAFGMLDKTENRISAMNDRIEQVERLQSRLSDLSRGLKEMSGLAARRSQVAEWMQDIGVRIPESVWLDGLKIQTDIDEKVVKKESTKRPIHMSGWAADETQVAILLGNMEESPLFSNVSLLSVERISEKDVWDKSKIRKICLVRFSMTAELSNRIATSNQTIDKVHGLWSIVR